jgi:transposase
MEFLIVAGQRGYSRDQRSDCKQVCIGLVCSPEGLPLSFEVFAGNRADVTTVEEIVRSMEDKYGQAERVWVMDRGMVSEKNIEFLRARKARYLVGTPKSQLREFEAHLLDHDGWHDVQEGLEARLVPHPDGKGEEQYVICRSTARAEKERAMLARQTGHLAAELTKIDAALRLKPQTDLEKLGRRIGRWLGKYPAAAKVIAVDVLRNDQGAASGLEITSSLEKGQRTDRNHGAYLLRTNCTETDPAKLWRWYIQLTQAEAAFRTAKSDLKLRPIYHQIAGRVEAHILVCFLALALWRVLEQWMSGKGLGTCARKLVAEISTIKSMDVVLPVKRGEQTAELTVRTVARPERHVAELLARLDLELPRRNLILGDTDRAEAVKM